MTDIKNVFISHVHEDDSGLSKLKDLVSKHGLDVRDSSITSDKPNQAKNPDYIKNEILKPQIEWASTLVVYVSAETKNSEWVAWEIEKAQKLDKRIVGVWAQGHSDCEIPEKLAEFGDAMVGWSGEIIVDAITGQSDDWHKPGGEPTDYRAINRYSC